MAIGTFRRFVGAVQGEVSLRMIERGHILPGLSGMAHFASGPSSIRLHLPHESVKSPLVRISVTARASQAAPVVLRRWSGV